MLIVMVVLTVLVIIGVAIAFNTYSSGWVELGICIVVILLIADLLTMVFGIDYIANGCTSKDKIEMYKQENIVIEEQIQTIVSDYKNYESETLEKFKNESPTVLVTLFPELKTNTLVNKQIDIYLANNNKIKQLKEKQIDSKIGKWLLYFGK